MSPNHHPTRGRLGRAASIIVVLGACATAREPVPVNVLQSGELRAFPHVLVVTRDSVRHDLKDVQVAGDSLVGTSAEAGSRHVRLELADVVRVDVLEVTASPALAAVGGFVMEVLAGAGRQLATFVRCIALKC